MYTISPGDFQFFLNHNIKGHTIPDFVIVDSVRYTVCISTKQYFY